MSRLCSVDLVNSLHQVPCCVHACNFPNRVASDGTPVRTYDAFLSYLELKDTRIRRSTLPIGGRNTVLWMDPQVRACARVCVCVCVCVRGGAVVSPSPHQYASIDPMKHIFFVCAFHCSFTFLLSLLQVTRWVTCVPSQWYHHSEQDM
jgi:hypothetical protein